MANTMKASPSFLPLIDYAAVFTCRLKNITIGLVVYIDYANERMDEWNALTPYFRKGKSFQHEQELRAVFWDPQETEAAYFDQTLNRVSREQSAFMASVARPDASLGKGIHVDLEILLKEIFVSPAADTWFSRVVESMMGKSGLRIPLTHSSLYRRDPLMD